MWKYESKRIQEIQQDDKSNPRNFSDAKHISQNIKLR